jgi:hypothetical protein
MDMAPKLTGNLAGIVRRKLQATGTPGRGKGLKIAACFCTAVIGVLAFTFGLPSKVRANDNDTRTFTVDVAFRNPYYQNNVNPAQDASEFSQGDTFIQDGSIYPGYTILDGKSGFDPNTPGAIGTYRARGTWTTDLKTYLRAVDNDKAVEVDRAMAFATELFSFRNERKTILTDGPMPNANFSAARIVLGGTGTYRDVIGEVHEENIGENSTGGCNLRVTFKIRRVDDARWR